MYSYNYLYDLTRKIFSGMGCSDEDSKTIAEILLKAEIRNISSHGMLRILDYFQLWKEGRISATPDIRVVHESVSTAVVDGGTAFGMIPAKFSMELAIDKARHAGTGWVATRNSNHFGIAGYYAMMALEHDMIGICVTNANPTVAPTFSVEKMLGTNPVAMAVPALNQPPLVADFATTPIPRGKVAIAEKKGEKLAAGLIQDSEGVTTTDPSALRKGGAILPLGSDYIHGSHKGYCMGSIVDILSGVVSGANFGPFVPPGVAYLPRKDRETGLGTGHFFGAMRIDAFMPADEFRARMDEWIESLRGSKPAAGYEKVLIPGDPEREWEEKIMKEGITIVPKVIEDMKLVTAELGIEFNPGSDT
jgi:LDH2 family malate/lactate/ureidoglycolate dehydrogenase